MWNRFFQSAKFFKKITKVQTIHDECSCHQEDDRHELEDSDQEFLRGAHYSSLNLDQQGTQQVSPVLEVY